MFHVAQSNWLHLAVLSTPERWATWAPWTLRQAAKLGGTSVEYLVDEHADWSIGARRQLLLDRAPTKATHMAYLDDDDWQSTRRAESVLDDGSTLARSGYLIDALTGAGRDYEPPTPHLAGSVLRLSDAVRAIKFRDVSEGEDGAFVAEFLKLGEKFTLERNLHAWISWGKNVVNRPGRHRFDLPPEYVRAHAGLSAEEWAILQEIRPWSR